MTERDLLVQASCTAVQYGLLSFAGLFATCILAVLILDKFVKKPDKGWGPWGWLFPKRWCYVWIGYFAMLVFTTQVMPLIIPSFSFGGGA